MLMRVSLSLISTIKEERSQHLLLIQIHLLCFLSQIITLEENTQIQYAQLNLLMSMGYLYYGPSRVFLVDRKTEVQAIQMEKDKANAAVSQPKPSVWRRLWRALIHIIRFFHLLIIFAPPILLFPLLFFKRTQNYWRDVFVKSIERAGVVFIKAFQYLSHRRDIIGPQMAQKFEHLRENLS